MKMKSRRFMLSVVLMLLSTMTFAQSDAHKSDTHNSGAQKPEAPKSEAQKSFDIMKTLAGNWQGTVKMDPPNPKWGEDIRTQVSLRVTSRGNALVHEMKEPGKPDDPARYDHPVTMLYLEGERLLLTHYCDAGNRPRMTGKVSEDGKKVEFEFLDLSGGNQHGHMYHAVFTIIDANHHIEEWTYMMPGDKPMHGRLDLQRSKDESGVAGQ